MSSNLANSLVSLEEGEINVKMGSDLVLMGEFKYQNGILKAESIDYFGKSLYEIIQKNNIDLKWGYIGLTICGSILGYFAIKKFVIEKSRTNKALKEKTKKEFIEKMEKISEDIDSEFKCIICCCYPRNVVFKPCKHLIICSICYESIEDNSIEKMNCIICKQKIANYLEIEFIEKE